MAEKSKIVLLIIVSLGLGFLGIDRFSSILTIKGNKLKQELTPI